VLTITRWWTLFYTVLKIARWWTLFYTVLKIARWWTLLHFPFLSYFLNEARLPTATQMVGTFYLEYSMTKLLTGPTLIVLVREFLI
jgi:hypothetical protein